MAQGIAWKVKGQVAIACNCDYGCPCNVNARPTRGDCEGGWTWQIEEGVYGDARLDGLSVGLYADWPKAIHEGDGVAVYVIDERATEAQRAALRMLVEGQAGGPWAIFRKTLRELHGPHYARFSGDAQGGLPRVRAEGVVELSTEFIRNPITKETIHPRVVMPEGLIVKEAALLGSSRFVVTHDKVTYDHSGKYAAHGFFQYVGP
ncbi:MAG: DUF1326 domain-containing protein [Acidobacteria bacterium]|nr:DUF1326 domain-containing protein [Acidobacteriota bacterium]